MLCPETSRNASLWTKEPAEAIRLKEALDRSAPCPWLLLGAWIVDVEDDVEDADDDAMVQPCPGLAERTLLKRNDRIWNIKCRNIEFGKDGLAQTGII
jgi:hypothetical protein